MRQARRALELCPQKAEKHLGVQIQVQREALLRRGVDAGTVERQVREFEAAIRAEMWRQTFSGGGAA